MIKISQMETVDFDSFHLDRVATRRIASGVITKHRGTFSPCFNFRRYDVGQQTIPNSDAARDVAYLMHPYTNARKHEDRGPVVIERGSGVYVYDDQGKEYIEGLAGLWSVAVGFGEERLVNAASEQLRRLPFYHLFAHRSHSPAIQLSERLVSMTPDRLQKTFFTNSGSEANDTVIKIVRFFNNAVGRPEKKKIISRLRGYHGINVASGSLTGLPLNHADFDLPIDGILHVSCPHHYREAHEGESEEEFATRLAGELDERIEQEGPETVAAFIGEPVMGAGGVIVPPATYWRKVQDVCRKHDVLIIADEVITGFGRLGTPFGCDSFDIDPDIMVLSKQLSSSYQPLAAVLFSDEIYQAVADNTNRLGSFGHGYTAGGHPVATAVALENLDIIEERNLVGNAAELGAHMQKALRLFSDHPLVGEVRGTGLIGAVELVANKATKTPFEPKLQVGGFLGERAMEQGLIIRPLLDTIAFCPPLIINRQQIDDMIDRFAVALDQTAGHVETIA